MKMNEKSEEKDRSYWERTGETLSFDCVRNIMKKRIRKVEYDLIMNIDGIIIIQGVDNFSNIKWYK